MRFTTLMTFAVLSTSTFVTLAEPTRVFVALDIHTKDGDTVVSGTRWGSGGWVHSDESVFIRPFNSSFGNPIVFRYLVSTVGTERTITFRYTTSGDRFIEQAASEALTAPPLTGEYAYTWVTSGIRDDEWDGEQVRGGFVFSSGADVLLVGSITSSSLAPRLAFADDLPFHNPNFHFGIGRATRFERTITYNIIPTPGAIATLSVGGLFLFRRRRS